MALPPIPTDLAPAPRPDPNDPTYAGRLRRSDWQAGPHVYVEHITRTDGAGVTSRWTEYTAQFPTFGPHTEQSRLLRAAGYRYTGTRWWCKKNIPPAQLSAERQWALALYRALHPSWAL